MQWSQLKKRIQGRLVESVRHRIDFGITRYANSYTMSRAWIRIDKIEILKGTSAAVFGHRGMNGIIAVYLDQAGKRWEYVPIGIVKKEPKGYYRSREFYSPNYETAPEQFEGPDYRNTLYWAPFGW